MQIITIYAVVNDTEIIATTKNQLHAQEQCDRLNKVNNTDVYVVVACNGVILK